MNDIEELKSQVKDLAELVQTLASEVKTLRTRTAKQVKTITTLDVSIKRLQGQMERNKIEHAALQKAIASASTRSPRWR